MFFSLYKTDSKFIKFLRKPIICFKKGNFYSLHKLEVQYFISEKKDKEKLYDILNSIIAQYNTNYKS
jgi:hypothetical protein